MKYYFCALDNKKIGPLTLDEIRLKHLKKSTLVWTDGMNEWIRADNFEELKDVLIGEPPPLPSKYDPTYIKEIEATVVGITLTVVAILLKLVGILEVDNIIQNIIYLILVIIITIWVFKISSRQNRSSASWALFAFFFPTIVLTIIGLLGKLSDPEKPVSKSKSELQVKYENGEISFEEYIKEWNKG